MITRRHVISCASTKASNIVVHLVEVGLTGNVESAYSTSDL